MRIISCNVNGIRSACRKGLANFIKQSAADVICLQELKSQEDTIPDDLLSLDDYHLLVHSAKRKGYSGVAVLTKIDPLFVSGRLGLDEFDFEGRMLEVELDGITVVNLYLPHGGRQQERMEYKLATYAALLKHIEKLVDRPAILTGDFNIACNELDLANPKQNRNNTMFTSQERSTLMSLIEMGWIDSYRFLYPERRQYTWWIGYANARARNIGWRIDYMFVSQYFKNKILDASILDQVFCSDHCPIELTIER